MGCALAGGSLRIGPPRRGGDKCACGRRPRLSVHHRTHRLSHSPDPMLGHKAPLPKKSSRTSRGSRHQPDPVHALALPSHRHQTALTDTRGDTRLRASLMSPTLSLPFCIIHTYSNTLPKEGFDSFQARAMLHKLTISRVEYSHDNSVPLPCSFLY
jgi:hypothetical protein